MPKREQPTSDGVYAWAVENNVPAPDAFAMQHWYLDGRAVRLKIAATAWRRRVKARRTGFPAIDEN